MRGALAVFTLIAVTLLVLFLLYRPPLELRIAPPMPSEPVRGSPIDSSPRGYSMLVSMLISMGYNVSLNASNETVNLLLVGNYSASSLSRISVIVDRAVQGLGAGGQLSIVVAPEKTYLLPATCRVIDTVLRSAGFAGPNSSVIRASPHRLAPVISLGGSMWLAGSSIHAPPGAGRPVAWIYPNGSVGALLAEYTRPDGSRVEVLYIGSSSTLQNAAIQAGLQRGVDPAPYVRDLLLVAGVEPGESLAIPLAIYRPPSGDPAYSGFTLRLNIRSLIAEILESVGLFLTRATSTILSSTTSLALVGAGALLAGMLLARLVLGPTYGRRELKPLAPQEQTRALGLSREFLIVSGLGGDLGRIDSGTARALIRSLYRLADIAVARLYGVSLSEAVGRGLLLPGRGRGLTGDERLDRLLYRLHVIYTRKIESRKLFPIVLSLRREARVLYEGLMPLLERARIRLAGERGLEYVGI